MTNFTIAILCHLFCTAGLIAQNVADHNSVYEKFSLSYKNLDAELLGQQYTKDAVLLNLYDGRNPNSVKGSENIMAYFKEFFQKIKKNGQSLELSFKITDRENSNNVFYDNGYYKLTIASSDGMVQASYGKLSTVIAQENGVLKFSVDANTNSDEAAYLAAKVGNIP